MQEVLMSSNEIQRPKFFEQQYLGAEDLTAVVDYARTQQARFALAAHTWGIAVGLELKERPLPEGGVAVYLLPGYAWDGYGRPIVVLSPYRIPEERFAEIKAETAEVRERGLLVPIWLRYLEKETSSLHSLPTHCVPDSGSRVRESFAIEIGPRNESELTSGVNLNGRLLSTPKTFLKEFDPAAPLVSDESVPHQNFSAIPAKARWLIPIGYVRWLPLDDQPGRFLARDDSGSDPDSDKIRHARRYIGVIAERIEAPAGAIRIRSRLAVPSNDAVKARSQSGEDDLLSIEGNLRVEGDNKICGGTLDFLNNDGNDSGVPIRLARSDVAPGSVALRLLIGTKDQTTNRFAIAVQDGDAFQDKFVILSNGRVGIGTSSPTDNLEVVGDIKVSGLARKLDAGGWTYASDARLKANVETINNALAQMLRLRGVSFDWKESDTRERSAAPQFGLVAQEVEKVFPEWVTKDSEGYRELTIKGFEALVVEALRDLKNELDDLKSKVVALKEPTKKKTSQRAKKTPTKA
jgi:hypothetical protein